MGMKVRGIQKNVLIIKKMSKHSRKMKEDKRSINYINKNKIIQRKL